MLSPFPNRSVIPFVSGIEHIDQHQWDGLVTDHDFFHSHGWLAALDHALGKADIFTLRGSSGLLGGCALWDGENKPGLFYLPDYFPGLKGPWQQPFLWVGARRSTHNEIPCVRGLRRGEALSAMGNMLAQLARTRKRYATIVPFMPLCQALEVARYCPNARVLMHSAEAAMTIPEGGLISQLQRMDYQRRRRTKVELAAFSRFGNRVEWRRLDDHLLELAAELITNNRTKYGNHQSIDWMRRMFDGQKKSAVIDSAVAVIAIRGNTILAITIFYRFGDTLHFRYYGSNYLIDDNDFRYFVLSYYHSLDYAVKNSIREYRFSVSSLRAKSLRGAEIEPLAALLLFDNENTAIPSTHECKNYNRLFYHEYQQQYGAHLSAHWTQLN
ncbi:hypothetical protein AC369_16630 [Salmonella enterica subsp. diarizonae]|uniref:peptidogalycan biosysnthesis protein n=1 Tax=Salmonella enterica TaxID=28901 RepID=UPI00126D4121|nr:hypothetical protein [Salmonella enterica]EBF4784120.1 hypothetical protein [Salmonella enterica subsp. diarizonae]EGF0274378.1 hypothetical protein [Salmonella enterica]EHP6631823.1 N-acetyltransferase [Salmonella enterica]EJR9175467.1 N-acetyltransferase [Salmonella enterica]